ncbi:hypothetical protein FZEAL_2243 [Fusarium zealandicum]|uniref:Macro domain-containing protein n=1 Tax=Fusarium zealandicum TaxID=1053134 RepID=A0A8H4XP20_9HYPO|nr:hypothetical protein FZEAL_2243 [Fusarium zealandicum]
MATKSIGDIPVLSQLYSDHSSPLAEAALAFQGQPAFATNNSINKRIGYIRGDITRLRLDAIVNAAKGTLLGGGGVDGAIHTAAGRELVKECATLGPIKTGEAVITKGYNLPAKHVIHAVGPIYWDEVDPNGMLATCYRESLKLAVKEGVRTVAFSSISTGFYGFPSQGAAKVACKTVREFLESEEGDKLLRVVFVTFLKKDVDAYNEALPGDSYSHNLNIASLPFALAAICSTLFSSPATAHTTTSRPGHGHGLICYGISIVVYSHTHCDEISLYKFEKWWVMNVAGNQVEQPEPNVSYREAVQRVMNPPTLVLFLSLLRLISLPASFTSRFNVIIIDPPLVGTRHATPLLNLAIVPTRGQALFIVYIVAINIILCAVGYRTIMAYAWYSSEWYQLTAYIANRTGVLSFANVALLILYSGRHNVLLRLTSWWHPVEGLVADVERKNNNCGTITTYWGGVKAHVSVGERMNVRQVLEAEIGTAGKAGTTVVECGPESMADKVRCVVTGLDRNGAVVRLVEESFMW